MYTANITVVISHNLQNGCNRLQKYSTVPALVTSKPMNELPIESLTSLMEFVIFIFRLQHEKVPPLWCAAVICCVPADSLCWWVVVKRVASAPNQQLWFCTSPSLGFWCKFTNLGVVQNYQYLFLYAIFQNIQIVSKYLQTRHTLPPF